MEPGRVAKGLVRVGMGRDGLESPGTSLGQNGQDMAGTGQDNAWMGSERSGMGWVGPEWDLLLRTYNVNMSENECSDVLFGETDRTATEILRMFHPAALNDFSHRAIRGDDNCLYRAVSLALYGNENCHLQLRLFTALELLEFPYCYVT